MPWIESSTVASLLEGSCRSRCVSRVLPVGATWLLPAMLVLMWTPTRTQLLRLHLRRQETRAQLLRLHLRRQESQLRLLRLGQLLVGLALSLRLTRHWPKSNYCGLPCKAKTACWHSFDNK